VDRPETEVGIIGLGIIGSRVANHLTHSFRGVWVWNRSPKTIPRFLGSPAQVAGNAKILLIFVKDGPALMEIMESLLPALTPQHLVVNHSTVLPDEALEAASLAEQKGAHFLDAPFTGSLDAAAAGELVYYIGGSEEDLERVRPVLELTSKQILHFGAIGRASLLKIATNMITSASVSALAEALAMVESSGMDGHLLLQALELNAARSGASDIKLPTMLEKDFAPRFSLENMTKDMRLAQTLLQKSGVREETVGAFLRHAERSKSRGGSSEDFSTIVQDLRVRR